MAITGLGGLGGLVSGMDTETLIQQLMAIERKPLAALEQTKKKYELRKELWSEINSSIVSLRGKVEAFFDAATLAKKKISSSDETYVKASVADPTRAMVGAYKITEIVSLATAEKHTGAKMASGWAGATNSGTLRLTYQLDGETYTSSDIAISAGDSLQTIAQKINAATYTDADGDSAARGIKATLVDNRLVLEHVYTGAGNVMGVAVDSGGLLQELGLTDGSLTLQGAADTTSVAAADAVFYMEGINGPISRSKNTGITDVVDGLKIDLLKATDGASLTNSDDDVTLTVAADADGVVEAIKAFIDQYNSTLDLINTRLKEEPVKDAKTDSLLRKGLLRGDSLLINFKSALRSISIPTNGYNPGGALTTLRSIGIETDSSDYGKSGKLVIKDEAKLRDAIENNLAEVQKLFFDESGEASVSQGNKKVDSGAAGYMAELWRKIDEYVNDSSKNISGVTGAVKVGRIPALMDGLDKTISSYDDKMEAFELRMEKVETRYRRQFTAMETAMANYQSQLARIQGQLSQLTN